MAVEPLRVLVADNDPDALELVAVDLRLEGHDVVGQCLDGSSAIDLCRQLHPDVLVADHRMPPGPSGLEVAELIGEEMPQVRVIVFTNYQDVELIERVRAAGATFLPKGNLRSLRRAVTGR